MLKFKPTCYDDYTIVDLLPGTGWCTGMLGAFLVASPEGSFAVGTGPALTKEKRQLYWQQRESLLGKKLRVKHELIRTTNKLPLCTVAIEVLP